VVSMVDIYKFIGLKFSSHHKLAKTEIIYPKNVRAKVGMDKYSAPRTIEKMKILGVGLELLAK
jgi:hypothetical protein